jgi:ribulose-phosphate 3-epimerase
MKLSASILSSDYLNLGKDIDRAAEAGCELLHLDVMDGHFVPNIAVGVCTVEALKSETRMRKDAHLMIDNPEAMIRPFIDAGADSITIHAESTPHHIRLLRDIKRAGKLAGIAITPETPVEAIRCALEEADIVLQVSVCVGFGGQSIIEDVYRKLEALREYKLRYGYGYEIQVDGGINGRTFKKVLESGADVLVAGSMLFGAKDMKETVRLMREQSV